MARLSTTPNGSSRLSLVEIHTDRLRLAVRPDLGAGIAALLLKAPDGQWHHVLRPAPPVTGDADELACFLLAPWVNRIADGTFRFQGQEHALRAQAPDGTAIHGDARLHAFAILDRSPVSMRLGHASQPSTSSNWPWTYHIVARYEVDATTLVCDLELTNTANEPWPAGLGFHPFWVRRLWDERDEVCVVANFAARFPLRGMLPTGPPIHDEVCSGFRRGKFLHAEPMDDVFVGSLDGTEIVWPESGVRACFRCSPELSHAVVYVPVNARGGAASWFCLEPVSMVNDGFNFAERGGTSSGVRVLSPGETLSARWSVEFRIGAVDRPTCANMTP